MYRWQLLIKEYGPEFFCIKGADNTVAGAIIRLDYNPELNRHGDDEEISKEIKWSNFLMLINHYNTKASDEENGNYSHKYSQVFPSNQIDDRIYPLTLDGIVVSQRSDPKWKKFSKEGMICIRTDPRKCDFHSKNLGQIKFPHPSCWELILPTSPHSTYNPLKAYNNKQL